MICQILVLGAVDPAIAAAITAIGAVVASLLTLFWTKGVDAHIRWIRAKKEANLTSLQAALAKLGEAEASIDKIQQHHQVCMEKHQDCERRCAFLEGRMNAIEQRLGQREGL